MSNNIAWVFDACDTRQRDGRLSQASSGQYATPASSIYYSDAESDCFGTPEQGEEQQTPPNYDGESDLAITSNGAPLSPESLAMMDERVRTCQPVLT